MKPIILLLLALPSLAANYPAQVSVLLDVGAKSLTVTNSGTGGSSLPMQFSPGASERVRFSITSGLFIPPPDGTTYSTCTAPCSVSINRNWGQPYYWVEYVDASGNSLTPRKLSSTADSFHAGCGVAGTLPQIEFPTVTTNPMPMPIEVIGQDCYAQAYQFPLETGHAFAGQRGYVRIANPGYNNVGKPDGKIQISINGAAYIPLTNAVVTGIDEMRFYGGIGSFAQVREFTFPIVDGTIGSGDTTVTVKFRFVGTDGIASGARILAFNILEADKTVSLITVLGSGTVARGSSTSNGFVSAQTVLMRGAPGMYKRFNGLRLLIAAATNTFDFPPCAETGCTPADTTYAPPVNRDTSGNAVTAQAVMYAARCAISKSSFVDTDPSTWTAPVGGDATRGQKLFTSGNASGTLGQTDQLKNPNLPYFNNTLHNATCGGPVGCHTSTGSDLYRFNYSNWSIKQRTIFHGFTAQDGDDIAAYIRGLSSTYGAAPAKGRPWNPPLQPGPGMSTATTAEFFAGCGIDCVLTYGYADMAEYFSADKSKWQWDSRLEIRDVPIPYQFADWNKGWLPTFHPADAFPSGNFLTSTVYLNYRDIIDNMTTDNYTSFASFDGALGQNIVNYRNWVNALPNALSNGQEQVTGNHYPSLYPLQRVSVAQYGIGRVYEVFVDKDVFKFGGKSIQAVHGGSETPNPNWPLVNGFGFASVFDRPGHKFTYAGLLDCSACGNGSSPAVKTADMDSAAWYDTEVFKGGGNGWGSADAPIDDAYLNTYNSAVQKYRPGGLMKYLFGVVTVPQNGNASPFFSYYEFHGAFTTSNGTDIVWSSGQQFNASMTGQVGHFNTTDATITYVDATHLTVTPSVGVQASPANYAINSGGRGVDFQGIWSAILTYETRFSYWWFSDAEWAQYLNDYLDIINGITAAHTTAYWQNITSTPVNAANAWNLSSGAPGDTTAMYLTLFPMWGADATKLATLKTWASAVWPSHDWDADVAASVQGDITNGATIDATGPGNRTVTFSTAGGNHGCPSSAAGAGSIMRYIITSTGGEPYEALTPTGGTCTAGAAGTLTFTTANAHTGTISVTWGCRVNGKPNYNFGDLTTPPWWICNNMRGGL